MTKSKWQLLLSMFAIFDMSAYERPGGSLGAPPPSAFLAGGRRFALALGFGAAAGAFAAAGFDFLAMIDSWSDGCVRKRRVS